MYKVHASNLSPYYTKAQGQETDRAAFDVAEVKWINFWF